MDPGTQTDQTKGEKQTLNVEQQSIQKSLIINKIIERAIVKALCEILCKPIQAHIMCRL